MFYIYRNLHRGAAFSIRKRGIVVDRLETFVAYNCSFKVNAKGREQVLLKRQKNVHAFVVANSFFQNVVDTTILKAITYNPYLANTFMCDGKSIITAAAVAFDGGRCFLLK